MASNPLYNLTWGEYGTSLISAVQLLRCQDELVDVTLAAGGRTFHAHKVVLCAASPFLLDLLKSTSCKHPVVMLAGVQASDLEALLEFVYRGEVSVDSSQLPSLLQAAHCLNIQGLSPAQSESVNSLKTTPNKTQELTQSQATQSSQEDENVLRRKKRAKRPRSPSLQTQTAKWSKVYVQTDGNNVLVNNEDNLSPSWSQQMNLVNVTTATSPITSLPIQTPILVQNIPVSINNNTSGTTPPKIRGASDQPVFCFLLKRFLPFVWCNVKASKKFT
ncbi:protein abrupt-like isoform X2 [Onthophagus taurus]|uniref:protein abrupt-like isoform X2 n=1 Tax=Onthophagus taurus TaxID=166361 RepID=UPI000C2064AF|nr:protein abrupt-like isoform X2 [Onthophagus taurus]